MIPHLRKAWVLATILLHFINVYHLPCKCKWGKSLWISYHFSWLKQYQGSPNYNKATTIFNLICTTMKRICSEQKLLKNWSFLLSQSCNMQYVCTLLWHWTVSNPQLLISHTWMGVFPKVSGAFSCVSSYLQSAPVCILPYSRWIHSLIYNVSYIIMYLDSRV